jgi:DNA-binding GntR family transcriptional regulator
MTRDPENAERLMRVHLENARESIQDDLAAAARTGSVSV